MRTYQLARLVFIFALIAASSGCGDTRSTEPAAPELVREVETIVVEPQSLPDTVEAIGTVRSAQTAQVASQLLANIVAVQVEEGDVVKPGQVLVILEGNQARAGVDRARAALAGAEKEVDAAQAELALAQATFSRFQKLFERKSASPQEFDEVRARLESAAARHEAIQAQREQARAALQQAEVMLGHTRLRAPFAGRITEKHADPGTLATPGMVLLVVEDTSRFRLDVTLDESEIGFVHEGQPVAVGLDSLKKELDGRVAQVVPAADPASRTFLIKVQLPSQPRLRSGLFGRARFQRGERDALLVPAQAVVRRGQLEGVFLVGSDGVAHLRYLTLGKAYAENVEVLSGLKPGERIVAAPGERELEGKRVEGAGR